jgi:hypothetical protein
MTHWLITYLTVGIPSMSVKSIILPLPKSCYLTLKPVGQSSEEWQLSVTKRPAERTPSVPRVPREAFHLIDRQGTGRSFSGATETSTELCCVFSWMFVAECWWEANIWQFGECWGSLSSTPWCRLSSTLEEFAPALTLVNSVVYLVLHSVLLAFAWLGNTNRPTLNRICLKARRKDR